MYRLKFGCSLRKIGKTVFLSSRSKTLEVSELSHDILRFLSKPRSLEEITDFMSGYFERANKRLLKQDMKELLSYFVNLGAVRTH